jgi:hypothetical protein
MRDSLLSLPSSVPAITMTCWYSSMSWVVKFLEPKYIAYRVEKNIGREE